MCPFPCDPAGRGTAVTFTRSRTSRHHIWCHSFASGIVAFVSCVACLIVSPAWPKEPANQVQLQMLLKSLLPNTVIRAAVNEATIAGEKCAAPLITATKPDQFEDGTTFDFHETFHCTGRASGRNIIVNGRAFNCSISCSLIDPLTISISRFD